MASDATRRALFGSPARMAAQPISGRDLKVMRALAVVQLQHPEFDGSDIPGYDPATGMVSDMPVEYRPTTLPERLLDATGAMSSGVVDGVPIIGPGLNAITKGGAAALVTPFSDKSFMENYDEMSGLQQRMQERNPISTTGGRVTGAVTGVLPMIAAAPSAFGLTQTGMLAKSLASASGGAAVGGADAAVRSGGNVDETLKGTYWGAGTGLLSPAAAALFGKGASKIYDKVKNSQVAKQVGLDPRAWALFSHAAKREARQAGQGRPGTLVAKPLRNLASRSTKMYNPPVKALRPFEADYPHGAQVDTEGNLLRDIEGRPLNQDALIVGRRRFGEGDVAAGRAELVTTAEGASGIRPAGVERGALPANQVGAYSAIRRGGDVDKQIFFANDLSDDAKHGVVAHELGHALNDIAGTVPDGPYLRRIPNEGLSAEQRRVYNDLNTTPGDWRMQAQERTGEPIRPKFQNSPETQGYRPPDVPSELWAESVRAYLADPNYIKTVAPKTAARIRAFVNNHPRLKNIIQFNAIPGALGAGMVADELGRQDRGEQ